MATSLHVPTPAPAAAPAAPTVTARASAWAPAALERSGAILLRYGLVAILVWFGVFKWTPTEAAGIQPLVAHSPLLAWLYGVTDVAGVSRLIGAGELVAAALIVLRPWWPALSAAGSLVAVGIFLTTLSFLATTPGAWGVVDGLLVPTGAGGFLVKDVFLLGAALWTAGEAWRAARRPGAAPTP